MGIPIYTQETILKFIGGLHSCLCHTILMFNPTNLGEVFMQDTHIESKGKSVHDVPLGNLSWKKNTRKKGMEMMQLQ